MSSASHEAAVFSGAERGGRKATPLMGAHAPFWCEYVHLFQASSPLHLARYFDEMPQDVTSASLARKLPIYIDGDFSGVRAVNVAAANRFKSSKPCVTICDSSLCSAESALARSNEAIRAFLSPTETSAVDIGTGRRFDSYLRNVSFGALGINEYRTSAVRDVRSKHMLRSNPNEDFYILRVLKGEGILLQGGKESRVLPGDIALYDSAKEFTWQFNCAAEMQIAKVCRESLLKRTPNAESLVARKIGATSPFAMMLGNIIDGALIPEVYDTDFDVIRYGQTITEMLSTCIDLSLNPISHDSRANNTLARAKKILSDNLDNCEFDLPALSATLNMSTSTISRAFATENTTAIRWLWSQRLESAYQLASSGSMLTVSQIALQCGFSEFSHFSRSFKKAYGVSPSELIVSAKGAKH